MASERTYRRAARKRGLSDAQLEDLRRTRAVTVEGLREIPEGALRRAIRRLDYPDLPRAREAFRLRQSRDDRGQIPARALPAALRQLDSTRARAVAAPSVAGMPTGREVEARGLVPRTAGIGAGPGGWVSLGPGNIGGRTRSIVVHPGNPSVIWAGSVGGGVWRTDDGGQSWAPVDDFMANLAVSAMVIDPTDPNVIYAGTGEGFSNLDALRGAGIFRTVDGSQWQQLAATTGDAFQPINRLALSCDGAVLLVATPNGLMRSDDPARVNWTTVLGEAIADVRCDPTDARRAIAGGLSNGEAYISGDGGLSWTPATHNRPWSGRVELAYAAADPRWVYASVEQGSGEIWRSGNGGRSFTRRRSAQDGQPAGYLGDQGWYGNTIWAGHPGNRDLVLVGGVDLWRSTDGGNTLTDISTWWASPASAHADHHCIVSHPGFDGGANRTVFFGNDGGIYRADDVTTVGDDPQQPRQSGWTELVNTYGVTQFYSGAGNPGSGVIIGGAQDNGTLRYVPGAGSEQWKEMFGGDGGWCAADPTDPDVFYGEYVFLNIHRSLDGGATADYISGQFWDGRQWTWKPAPYQIADAKNQRALFIAPFALDPNDSDRLLGGGQSLWRTEDAKTPNTDRIGPSWRAIKGSAGRPISALAIAPGDSDLVWVGHDDGQVYKSENATAQAPLWRRIDRTGTRPLSAGRYCTAITIDPGAHDIVYVTFGGYVGGNVFKTTDGGASWSGIGAALPAAPVRALTLHPADRDLVYLGTEVGLFASEDAGATWSPTNEGPTNCSVEDLFWLGTVLVCVTHGRGMFKIDLAVV